MVLVCNNDECPHYTGGHTRFKARCCMEDCPYCGQEMVRTDIKS
jgi:hypothetical protein